VNDTLDQYKNLKQQVANYALRAHQILSNVHREVMPIKDGWEVLPDVARRVLEEQFNLVVAGEFSSGKSFFINVLLDAYDIDSTKEKVRGLLPDRISPTTSSITVLQYGESTDAVVTFENGQTITVPRENVQEYIADISHRKKYEQIDAHDPVAGVLQVVTKAIDEAASFMDSIASKHRRSRVQRVVLECPSPWLAHGVRIVDTPGTGSVIREHADVTVRFIPEADAIIFLFPCQPPINEPTKLFLSQCAQHVDKMFFVQTMMDREFVKRDDSHWEPRMEGDKRTVDVALEQNIAIIKQVVPNPERVFSVSAKWYAFARRGYPAPALELTGMPALINELERFLVQVRGSARLIGHLSKLRKHLEICSLQLQGLLETEQKSLEEVAQQKRLTEQEIQRLTQWSYHAENSIRAQIAEINQRLQAAIPEAVREVSAALNAKVQNCTSVRDVNSLSIVLPVELSGQVNRLIALWNNTIVFPSLQRMRETVANEVNELTKGANLEHLSSVVRVALSRMSESISAMSMRPELTETAQRIRELVNAAIPAWLDFLSHIPVLGTLFEFLSYGSIERGKNQISGTLPALAQNVVSLLGDSFTRTLDDKARQVVSELQEHIQRLQAVSIGPLEQRLASCALSEAEHEKRLSLCKSYLEQLNSLLSEVDNTVALLGKEHEPAQMADTTSVGSGP
jgi:hypothetical protein